MTSKELFCKIVEKAQKQNNAICALETALGGIVVENENLFGIFNKSDEICGFLVWGEKEIPDWFYALYWDFILNGEVGYYDEDNDAERKVMETPEQFYDFMKECADE